MLRFEPGDDRISVASGSLVLIFQWDGRRWIHSLGLSGRCLAVSVEWEPGRDDPGRAVSPAFQQCHHQFDGGAVQLLLVGQWGHHHFSGVFTVREGPEGVDVETEVAVRSHGPLEVLAATYSVNLTSSDLADASPGGVYWHLDEGSSGRLSFEPFARGMDQANALISLAEAGRAASQVQASRAGDGSSATQLLSYRWRWTPDRP